MHINRYLVVLFILLTPLAALAQNSGFVESLQMPAWYQRAAVKHALRADTQLQSGDVISTGSRSRVLLRLEEGSTVKLGENAHLSLDTLSAPQQQGGVFEALMNLTRGAFRFTTTAIGKLRPRQVKVHIGTVTVGIRGTDFWGSSKDDSDVLVLLEGEISAQREGEAEVLMDVAETLFVAPSNLPTPPLQKVDKTKLGQWAAETELQAQSGVIRADGRWAVNLVSGQDESAAQSVQLELDEAGYAADIEAVTIAAQQWYRVRISGFISRQDAAAFASDIENQHGIQQPWVVKF